jgi:carbon monoxide dehydrogenase subunit G
MARYRASIETHWTPGEAFAYLSDFSTSAEWDPGVVEADRTGPGPIGVGTEFRLVVEFLGRRTPLIYQIVEYEPPRAVTFVGENATVISHDRITVEASALGARVSYDAELKLKGVLMLVDPLMGLAFKPVGDRALAGLREVLERPARDTTHTAA